MAQEENSTWDNLEAFQTSKPTWDVIITMSKIIVNKYVTSAMFEDEQNKSEWTNNSDEENEKT